MAADIGDYINKIETPTSQHEIHDSRIPDVASSDNGKVLGVTNASGTLGWVEQSAGTITDVTVGGTSVVSNGVAVVPAIPSVATLTNNEIDTIWNIAMA